MNSNQIIFNVIISLLIMHFEVHSTTAAAIPHKKPCQTRSQLLNEQNKFKHVPQTRSQLLNDQNKFKHVPQTRSQLLNEQNKFKHVLYTLLSHNYVDAADLEDNIINDYNKLNEEDNEKKMIKMEHLNLIVDYLRVKIKDINEEILNLDEENWDTKNDNIIEIYKERKQLAKNEGAVEKIKKLSDNLENRQLAKNKEAVEKIKNPSDNLENRPIEKTIENKKLRFKRNPLHKVTLMFHQTIFNFDRNMSVEMDDVERKFATGVYLRGKQPEGEKKVDIMEALAKWRKEQDEKEAKEMISTTVSPTVSSSHSTTASTPPSKERHRRFVTTTTEATRPTLPDYIDNFGRKDTTTMYTNIFDNLIGVKDNRDPEKYTVRMAKFNPHPSAEYFVDKVENWVSWAHEEVTRLAKTPTTTPISTMNYWASKASVSRFFSLNPRYLQSTDEFGLNKWGGRQILPRSREDFTFDFDNDPVAQATIHSEEARSFYTWREAVNWSRIPSNRPSTHPWISIEMDKVYRKIFKCVSCNKWESKDLTKYIDHLYEHFLRNSLMIPSFEEALIELRRREALTGTETWRREF